MLFLPNHRRLSSLVARRVLAVGSHSCRQCLPPVQSRPLAGPGIATDKQESGAGSRADLATSCHPLKSVAVLALLLGAQPASGDIVFNGVSHAPKGAAVLLPTPNQLTVSNLGSSGQDGVEMTLPYTSGWEGHWQALETPATPLPVGAYVQSQVFGNAGSISNGLLGSWTLTKKATGNYVVSADYTPLGSTTVTVQVYNGTALVATRSHQSGPLGSISGCVLDDHHGNPVPTFPFGPFGSALTFSGPPDPAPLSMILGDGTPVIGDRLVILPEGATAVSSLTRVNLLTSGVPQIAITSEAVQSSVGTYHNAAMDYVRAQGLWGDGVTPLTSNNVTQITNAVGAYLKSVGFDPAATDAASAAVLQGFSQANLFYTTASGTYFGAPVTSDQFVPYLMARLQTGGAVSADFVAKVNIVNNMVVSRADSAAIMSYVASSFLGTFTNAADNHAAEVFVDTYTKSYAYWTDPAHLGGSGGGNYALAPGDGVIIADAAGALYGLLLGPVGSILYGAAASIIANNASIAAPSGNVGYSGLNQVALGTAALDVKTNRLIVSNLGSSGQDGVSIPLPYTSAWDGQWLPLDDNNTLPVGAYVQSQVFGNAGTLSDGLLGSWRLTKQGTGHYAVTADYSPLGSTTVTVQVYNGMTLVATRTGQSGQLAIVNGCVEDDHHGNPVPTHPFGPFGGALTMFGPLDMTLADGATVTGDRFVILPEGATAVSSLTRVSVQTSGVPQFVITSEGVQDSVGTYHNAALDYLRAQGLWMVGVTRFTSNNVTQVTNSIGDYLKSVGFDPATTDAASASVLQSLNQANLLYTSAGGTYFGAPVTSDQFIPYVMARMQASGAVSADFVAKVNVVNSMIVSRADSAAVMSYVSSSFLGAFTSAADNHAAEVFVDTYTKSYAYWTDPSHWGGSGGGDLSLAPGDGVILADAAGGLYGLLLGPVGSILYGAAFSIIANNSSMVAPSGNTGYNGLNQVALGSAALDVKLNRLIVSNLGSSGQDGVSITLPNAASWEAHWLPLDPTDALPVGASVQSQAFGTAGTSINGLLGSWKLTKTGTGSYAVTADFSQLGSSTVTLQVFNGTTLVTTLPGQSGALAIVNGCVDDDHWGNPTPSGPYGLPGPFGGALTFLDPRTFTFLGGATALGDRLVIVPEGGAAVSSLTQTNVLASGIPQIAIDEERHFVEFAGLLQGSLGQAGLSVTGGQLTVSNLGSSGQDGVEIELGALSQRKLNLYYQTPEGDGTLSFTGVGLVGTQSDQALGKTSIDFSGSTKTLSFDYSAIGAATYTLRIYDGKQLVHESHGHTGPCVVEDRFPYPLLPLDDVHLGWYEEGPDEWNGTFWVPTGTWHDGYTCDTSPTSSTQRVIGGPTVHGNLVLAIPENPTATVGAASRTKIQTSGQIASLQFSTESLSSARTTATALGQATFAPDGTNLTVGNLGSSGQDGVSIALPDTSAWEGHWLPLETTASPLPPGAYVQSQVFGNAGSVSDGLLGTWRLTKKGTGNYVVTADYSPLGSATVMVQVYNGNVLVATRSGQSGQLGTISGCVEDDHHGNPVPTRPFGPFGGALTMFGPLDMTLADGAVVTGDRFVILPEGAAVVDSLTRVNVQTSGVAQLVLTSEAVQPTVGALHNTALDYLNAQGLWMNGVTRFTSANVTQVTNAIGAYLKSVNFDPTATDAACASVLQSLSQANLLYTSAGVTYFGAPVTSDQFVPYLMAGMQASGAVSADFVAKVNVVNSMIVSRADSAAILSYVSSSFLGSFTSAADNHAAEVFVDTYTKSYAYWNDPSHWGGGSGGGSYALAPGDGVIIADAAGGLYGLLLGPVGSILYGAAFSIIANNSSIAEPPGNTGYNGLNQVALGSAALDVKLNRLIVSNLGSSGQDGVSIPMPKAAAWEAHWLPLDPTDALPVGAYIQSQAFGVSGTGTNGLLGWWKLAKTGTGSYAVTADFSQLGSSTVTLEAGHRQWLRG